MEGRTGSREGAGSGLPTEAFLQDARGLTPEEFESRHGSGYLLLTATSLASPADTASTELQLFDDDDAARTGALSFLVYPLGAAFPIATIGRSSKNDVIILDPSVSRIHAFVKRTEMGVFLMLDAGSANGTIVNGENVLARGSGPPTPLKPGDNVRLGRVELTFVDPQALRDFVIQVG